MKLKKPSPEKPKQIPEPVQKKEANKKEEAEIGGFKDSGLAEPTRFGDWEVKGRCSDF